MNFDTRILGMPSLLFWSAGFILGLAAFIPAIVAWFTAEELALLYVVRDNPFAIWTGLDRQPGFFRPLIPIFMWLWQNLWGLEPRPYHLLNVVLHGVNSWLVYLVARRWTAVLPDSHRLKTPVAASLAALWFWVWPAHSESVSWIPALTDVGAASAALGSLGTYLVFRTGGSWAWAVAAVLLYVVALSTKESAITLPAAIFVYEFMRAVEFRVWRWKDMLLPLLFVGVMAGYFLLRRMLMGVFLGGYGADVHGNYTWERLQYVLSPNLANAFLPLPWLNVYQKNWLVPAFGVACAVGIAWRRRRGGGSWLPILALALSGVLVFLPGLNLGPGLIMEGQRFAYLPSAFGAAAVAFAAVYILPRGRPLTAIAWVLAICGAVLLANYNTSWYVGGKMARSIVRGMKKLPPARRTYVLTTTDSYREAFVLPHSLDPIYKLMVKEPMAGELVVASAINNWKPDLRVQARPVDAAEAGAPAFLLWLEDAQGDPEVSRRLEGFTNPYTAQWYEVRQEGDQLRVQLKDFNPATDQVYLINGKEWVEVAGKK